MDATRQIAPLTCVKATGMFRRTLCLVKAITVFAALLTVSRCSVSGGFSLRLAYAAHLFADYCWIRSGPNFSKNILLRMTFVAQFDSELSADRLWWPKLGRHDLNVQPPAPKETTRHRK
jgi:hypothetical protein